MKVILNKEQLSLTLLRLAHQLVEKHVALTDVVFIGIQPRGLWVSDKIVNHIKQLYPHETVAYGQLDITFYRDDVREQLHIANSTNIPFSIEGKQVILIDDVLYTGRTVRASLDALLDFGRPKDVALCVLVERRFDRELPIQPNFCGKAIDAIVSEKVKVIGDKWEVVLY
jgi:pyrimidine operon attenuation protein / uracil phosphoribosyltransferase